MKFYYTLQQIISNTLNLLYKEFVIENRKPMEIAIELENKYK